LTPKFIQRIAKLEGISSQKLQAGMAKGEIVIPVSKARRNIKKPCAVGSGTRTKINANIGASLDNANIKNELNKLKAAVDAGADAVMDLSTGGNLSRIRKRILEESPVPVGTVPIYEAAMRALKKHGSIASMSERDIFKTLKRQAEDGVDFFTVHCGVTLESVNCLRSQPRVAKVVSRGGAFLIDWMAKNNKENPLYANFKEVLEIAKEYGITLSLGDGLRPGSILDASDRGQLSELVFLGDLADRAQAFGVQTIIEGPGHVPLNQIEANVAMQKRICRNKPFYVLGPLVTDIAPGYDHITSAIGGAIAAASGADFLCYVTPSEHLRLPDAEDVRTGVIASRIAAHAADIAKGTKGAVAKDRAISQARQRRDWKRQIELSIDPGRAKDLRGSSNPKDSDTCTMCGDFCSIKIMDNIED